MKPNPTCGGFFFGELEKFEYGTENACDFWALGWDLWQLQVVE